MSFAQTFINNYGASTTGIADASYVNKVYLGTEKVKREKVTSPTGVEYTTAGGVKDRTETIAQAKARYLTDDKLRANWNVVLRKNGLEADPLQARAIWDMAVEGASDWYSTSNGQQKVTPEQYVTWYATGRTKGKTQVPTRQIYNVTPEQIDADIDEIAVKTLGRTLQDADRNADWYKDLVSGVQKLYAQGVVTEPTRMVRNKETGKMERIAAQTPGFSKEQVTRQITEAVKEADPASLERKQNLDFANWAFQKMGGRG